MNTVWNIQKLYTTNENGMSNIVTRAAWQVKATEGDQYAVINGDTGLAAPTLSSFIEYNNLTEEQVLSWVKAVLGPEKVQFMENQVIADLEKRMATSSSTTQFPWSAA